MSHPRIEEVSDSDDAMSDPSEDDIDDFVDSDIMRRVDTVPAPAAQPQRSAPQQQQQQQHQFPPRQHAPPSGFPQMQTTTDEKAYKSYQCLYPVYFDSTRTRAEGRRVPRSLAVANPLAIDIVKACAGLRLQAVLEAGKLHPKDWANPGRVKVNLRHQREGHPAAVDIKNKHHLYVLVATHLRANPTTDASPSLRVEVGAIPMPPQAREQGKPWPRPAVPRGWKMGELLPYYSSAMTGGGVSENFLKDMMKEMQQGGGGPGGMPDMTSLLAAAGGGMGGTGGGASGSGSGGGKKEKKGKGK
ncbi:signal recognition particle SEC65 subunit [Staphylotrichum tortipilum]|uniref:Signal recognition particle SEC65 subunit n=1 Tax=Staphylotrichum tortipilum TaxID=2831512 RepID=A0AAN6RUN2_9PEZI|nr:signal recognition particle SEC65 subunit [Staphylotrichum longicolle]